MIDSENSRDNYQTLKISIIAIRKSSEMLKFTTECAKVKKMRKHVVESFHL